MYYVKSHTNKNSVNTEDLPFKYHLFLKFSLPRCAFIGSLADLRRMIGFSRYSIVLDDSKQSCLVPVVLKAVYLCFGQVRGERIG